MDISVPELRPAESRFVSQEYSDTRNFPDVFVKKEVVDDSYYGNSFLHVINLPASSFHDGENFSDDRKPGVIKQENLPLSYTDDEDTRPYESLPNSCGGDDDTRSYEKADISIVRVKQEPGDAIQVYNCPRTTAERQVSASYSEVIKTENGNKQVFKKIGELLTMYNNDPGRSPSNDIPTLLSLDTNYAARDTEPENSKNKEKNTDIVTSVREEISQDLVSMEAEEEQEEQEEKELHEKDKTNDDTYKMDKKDNEDSSLSSENSSLSSDGSGTDRKISYVCSLCGKMLSSAKGLKMHTHHCKKHILESRSSSSHVNKTESKLHSCPDCGKVFQVQNLLVLHSLTHTGEFPFVCEAERCDKAFKTKPELESHKTRCHSNKKKVYTCETVGCHKVFQSPQGLKNHSLKHKALDLEFQCEHCPKKFATAINRRAHVYNAHGKSVQCDKCSKTFNTVAMLRQHMLVHTDQRPHKCPKQDCDKAFKCAGDLRRHVMLHSKLKPFVCEHCKSTFRCNGDLKKHMAVHQTDRPLECPECGKFFKTPEHLRKHRAHHLDSKVLNRYICPFDGCRKAFPVPIKLKNHLQRHSSERSYKCSVDGCNKSFKVREDLTIHQRKVHLMKKKKITTVSKVINGS